MDTTRAAAKNKFKMVRLELARAADYGHSDKTFIVNTHLGEFINFNDTVLAYDLNQMNHAALEEYEASGASKALPDMVVVRKGYPRARKRQQRRIWKLKHLDKQPLQENNIHTKKSKKNEEEERNDYDYKAFLEDIEEDPDIRRNVDKYRDEDVIEELLGKLSLEANTEKKEDVKKSPMLDALSKGEAVVDGQQRKVVKGARKTAQGKQMQQEAEA